MKGTCGNCQPSVGKLSRLHWKRHEQKERTGKLCYYICSEKSVLPIRNAPNKEEPNYETRTYNCCATCNQHSIKSAIKNGLSHIFFVTRYKGKIEKFQNKIFIIGYYEIGYTAKMPHKKDEWRYCIKATRMSFVRIEHGYPWKKVNNLRNATQRIFGVELDSILKQMDRHNIVDAYKHEVKCLAKQKECRV